MCLLALVYRVAGDAPVVVGANREESYQRGGDPPRRLDGVPAVAGVDPTHGGTWLGVNASGLLVAVTNRPRTQLPVHPRSRGLLVRDLLACPTAAEAARRAARELETGAYAGCNYLCADARDAVVLHAGDWLRVRPLPPGIHVLANSDINDPVDRRVTHALGWLSSQPLASSSQALLALRSLCASHEPAGHPICFRDERRGTVSSSLLALPARLRDGIYLHAQGAPDRVGYENVSSLLGQLTPSED